MRRAEKERKSDSKSAAEAAAAAVGGSSLFDSAYDFPSGLKRSNSGLGLSGTPSFSYSRASLYGVLPFDKENLQPNFIRDTSMPLIARKGSKQYQFSMDTLTPTEMAYLTSSTVSTSNGGDRHPLCMPPPQPPAVTNSTVVAPRGGGGSSVPSRAASFSGIGAIADHVSLPPGAAPTHSLLQYVSATAVAVAATPASVAKSILPLSALSHAYGSALAGWDWTLPQLRESATRTLDSAAGNESTSDSSSPSGGGSSIYTIDDDNDNEICVVLHPLPPVAPVPVVPPSPALPPVAIAPVTPAPILAAVSQTSIGAGGSQDPRTDSQVADEFLS